MWALVPLLGVRLRRAGGDHPRHHRRRGLRWRVTAAFGLLYSIILNQAAMSFVS
jgi:hypothetical protein